jgi:hypothetical protein
VRVCFSVAAVAGVAETGQTAAKTQNRVAECSGGKHNVFAIRPGRIGPQAEIRHWKIAD